MRIIIAGGGTGGHVYPAIAIGNALRRLVPNTELLFVGAKGKMEMELVPREGFKIEGLEIAGFNRSKLWKNWSLPIKLWKSKVKSQKILNGFKPDAVVGVGGFASFPVLQAAQKMGIPTVIQEQNSFAGKTNKILGRKADAICVAYNDMERFFPKDRLFLTGNPVRETIASSVISRDEGIKAFGLRDDKLVLLVIGGSLGARNINLAIEKALPTLREMDIQLIWQTGKLFISQAKELVEEDGGRFIALEFLNNMEYAYAAADMVVSRAGALASAELCIAGKPVVFVPYPFAAEDHQTENAMALVNHNAALVLRDNEVGQELINKLKVLSRDDQMRKILSENISARAIKDADERIAKKIMEVVQAKKRNEG